MSPTLLTNIIIAVAILAAIIVVILLIKKLIKSIFAIILIGLIVAGGYIGVRTIDQNTNLRNKLEGIDQAFTALEQGHYNIKSAQCNHLGNGIGVNVIYTVDASQNQMITDFLLDETRKILLDDNAFSSICSLHNEEGLPKQLLVGIKYNGLDILYYTASLEDGADPSAEPKLLYDDFELVVDTSAIKTSIVGIFG